MFSSTRLHAFVCLALGLAASAAPAGAPGANVDARSPDVYDLSGSLVGLLLGSEGRGSDSDEDTYILKRQLAGLDIGSRLGSNIGLQHAALLAQAGLAFENSVETDDAITKRDIYDLSGGLIGLLLGSEGRGGDSDEDTYILKRQLAGLDIGSRLGSKLGIQHAALLGEGTLAGLSNSASTDGIVTKRDVYDIGGGLGALLFGLPEGYGGDSDEDVYILKRQLAGLDIGSRLGSNIGLQHVALLGEGALGLGNSVGTDSIVTKRDVYDLGGGLGALLFGGGNSDEDVYILKRDVYDLSGGIGALLFGNSFGGQGNEDSDAYILKREDAEVEARSPDVYDLTGGLGALIFGNSAGYGGDSDEDVYVLKRQLEGLGSLGSHGLSGDAASLLSDNAGSTSTDTSADASGVSAIGAGAGFDPNSILSGLGDNANLASSFGLGN